MPAKNAMSEGVVAAAPEQTPTPITRYVPVIQIPNKRLFGVSAAARYLGISDDTLRKYADLGQIRVYRFLNGHRVFKLEDLNRLIDELPLWNDHGHSDTTRAGRNGGIA